jgi:ketol-acid reductoisomerase
MYASGELSEIFGAARDMGFMHQLKLHSRTSQYGQVITGKKFSDEPAIKQQFTDVINHIKSGDFEKEWDAEEQGGYKNLLNDINDSLKHPMNVTENRVYKLLGRRDVDLVEADWVINK